jgi:hypothetical protein
MPKVTWLGDEDPHLQSISEGGVTFVKGEPVTVNAKHMFGGVNWFDKFNDNPMFAVDNEDAEVVGQQEDERAFLKGELDRRGISYAKNATIETLRKKFTDGVETGPVDDGGTDLSHTTATDPNAPAVPLS